jgi:PAS domain S-box-containing protein
MDETYQSYFESMPCYLSVQGRDLKIIRANRRFVENFGDPAGRYCYQIYKQRSEKCERCPVERTFRDGEPHTSEEQVIAQDGRELWVLVNSTPIRDGSGEIEAVMEMSTDITDIKLLHQQLRESQQKHKLLFEEVPCYISIQDRDLNVVEANRLFREAFGNPYGHKCYKVYKHRDKACFPCVVQETFEDGETREHEETVRAQDGRLINMLVYTAPLRDENERIVQVIEMSTDITQLRQLQDKLSDVGLLIGSISHGIKGLLNGLDGGIYLINSGLQKDDRSRIDRGWEIALRNIDRIRGMVMDILYYAKDRVPDWQPIVAAELAADVAKVMEEKAASLNIRFEFDLPNEVGEFEGDEGAIRSLLVNLVDNSLDACRVDSNKSNHFVKLALVGTPEDVIFEVVDNGIGMDQETREKALSLFFSSKGAGGTGLGLFIANKITKAHRGTIELESEEGQGSHFRIKLPRRRPEDLEINAATD